MPVRTLVNNNALPKGALDNKHKLYNNNKVLKQLQEEASKTNNLY